MRLDSPSLCLAVLCGLVSALPAASEARQVQAAQWEPPSGEMCKFRQHSRLCSPEQCSHDANDFFLHNCPKAESSAIFNQDQCSDVVTLIQQMCHGLPAVDKQPWYSPSTGGQNGTEAIIGTAEVCRGQRNPHACLAERRTAREQCRVEARDFLYWRCFETPKGFAKLAGCIGFFLILASECENGASGY